MRFYKIQLNNTFLLFRKKNKYKKRNQLPRKQRISEDTDYFNYFHFPTKEWYFELF